MCVALKATSARSESARVAYDEIYRVPLQPSKKRLVKIRGSTILNHVFRGIKSNAKRHVPFILAGLLILMHVCSRITCII